MVANIDPRSVAAAAEPKDCIMTVGYRLQGGKDVLVPPGKKTNRLFVVTKEICIGRIAASASGLLLHFPTWNLCVGDTRPGMAAL